MIKYRNNTYLPMLLTSCTFSIIINFSLKEPQADNNDSFVSYAAKLHAFFLERMGVT